MLTRREVAAGVGGVLLLGAAAVALLLRPRPEETVAESEARWESTRAADLARAEGFARAWARTNASGLASFAGHTVVADRLPDGSAIGAQVPNDLGLPGLTPGEVEDTATLLLVGPTSLHLGGVPLELLRYDPPPMTLADLTAEERAALRS